MHRNGSIGGKSNYSGIEIGVLGCYPKFDVLHSQFCGQNRERVTGGREG